jgi:hypothetical protein
MGEMAQTLRLSYRKILHPANSALHFVSSPTPVDRPSRLGLPIFPVQTGQTSVGSIQTT